MTSKVDYMLVRFWGKRIFKIIGYDQNEVDIMPQVLMTLSFNQIEFWKTIEIYNLNCQNEEVVTSKRWSTGNIGGGRSFKAWWRNSMKLMLKCLLYDPSYEIRLLFENLTFFLLRLKGSSEIIYDDVESYKKRKN